jgi:hypothetical protein
MPIVLDTIQDSRISDSVLNGLQLVRGVTVHGLTFAVGEGPVEVWAKALLEPGMPVLGSVASPSYPQCILMERRLAGINGHNKTVRGELVYTVPPSIGEGATINYTLTDAFQSAHVLTQTTADGSENLYTLYKVGGDPTIAQTDPDAHDYSFAAPKIVVYRTLRAIGRATKLQWNAVKADVRAAAGKLNTGNWGSSTHPRGSWLFLGPITRTQDGGNSYIIQLDFVKGETPYSFYPIGFYRRRWDGAIPKDAATEDEVVSPGLPVEGGIYRTNGASFASIYKESGWQGIFSFGPDD